MELSAPLMGFLASLGVPVVWLVPITAVAVILLQKYLPNLKMPSLPVSPVTPPVPVEPKPVTPLFPNLSDRPVLDLLLKLLSLKAAGAVKEEDQIFASLLFKEALEPKRVELKG
jgi:hypothetical protein